jgi:hypothetical protein
VVARGDSSEEKHAEERKHSRHCEQPRRLRPRDTNRRGHVLNGRLGLSDRRRVGRDADSRRRTRPLPSGPGRRADCWSTQFGPGVPRTLLGRPLRRRLTANCRRARRDLRVGLRRRSDLLLRTRRAAHRVGRDRGGASVPHRRNVHHLGHGGRRRRRSGRRGRNRRRSYRSGRSRSRLLRWAWR